MCEFIRGDSSHIMQMEYGFLYILFCFFFYFFLSLLLFYFINIMQKFAIWKHTVRQSNIQKQSLLYATDSATYTFLNISLMEKFTT